MTSEIESGTKQQPVFGFVPGNIRFVRSPGGHAVRISKLPTPLPTIAIHPSHCDGTGFAEKATAACKLMPDSYEDIDDVQLILSIQNGCDRSFDQLFTRYWRLVFAIASRILRQRSDAEDVVQDVFLTIYIRSGNYDADRGSVRTWIAQFAYFKALVRRRSIQISDADNFDAVTEFESGLSRFGKTEGVLERAALAQECLALLNPRQRRAVELVHFDGYTLSETAAVLNQSLANTRNLYYRGIHSIRSQLLIQQAEPEKDRAPVPSLPNAAVEPVALGRVFRL